MQCYLWPGWPQWTPEGGIGAEVVWGRTWGGVKCAKSGTPMGTPMHSYRARNKMKKMKRSPFACMKHVYKPATQLIFQEKKSSWG